MKTVNNTFMEGKNKKKMPAKIDVGKKIASKPISPKAPVALKELPAKIIPSSSPMPKNIPTADSFIKWIGSVQSLLVHTVLFILIFILGFLGVSWQLLMLVLTTAVSLEAIYLAIFIQMSINRSAESLAIVAEDLGEIHENVGEIHEDVEEIQDDIDEIQRDVDDIQEDVEEIAGDVDEIQIDVSDIQTDMDEIQADVDDLQKDLDEIQKGDKKGAKRDEIQKELLKNVHRNMAKVKTDLERLRAQQKKKK